MGCDDSEHEHDPDEPVTLPCHARTTFGGGETVYTCTLIRGHRGPHRAFEWKCVASWPKERKRRTAHPLKER